VIAFILAFAGWERMEWDGDSVRSTLGNVALHGAAVDKNCKDF